MITDKPVRINVYEMHIKDMLNKGFTDDEIISGLMVIYQIVTLPEDTKDFIREDIAYFKTFIK
jgi:hypothetical protein